MSPATGYKFLKVTRNLLSFFYYLEFAEVEVLIKILDLELSLFTF